MLVYICTHQEAIVDRWFRRSLILTIGALFECGCLNILTSLSVISYNIRFICLQLQSTRLRTWIAWVYLLLLCFSSANGSLTDNLLSRWIPLPQNHCSGLKDYKSCPNTSMARKFREQVCLGITTGTDQNELYHCQHDSSHAMTYEFFMEPFMCPKGKLNFNEIIC